MKSSLAWLAVALTATATFAFEPHARAQASDADKAVARELFNDGAKALDAEKYAIAVDKFKKADELFHAPTMLIGLARAYTGLGKFVEAKETYNRVINEKLAANASDAFLQAQKDAAKEIKALDDKIGSGTISISADGGTLPNGLVAKLDDEELRQATFGIKRPMNPGTHRLVVTAPGYTDVERKFDVVSKRDVALEVKLAKAEATGAVGLATTTTSITTVDAGSVGAGEERGGAPPKAADTAPAGGTQRTLGWVSVGVGGAGLVLGGVAGGMAVAKHSALETDCGGGTCPAGFSDRIASYNRLGTISTAGFIAGGVFAATGVVLLVTAPKAEASSAAARFVPTSLVVGPANVQATFAF